MRTTITLDQDVYEAALHLSQSSGERLGKVVSELIRRGLGESCRTPAIAKKRFPTFDIAPDAPIIPASRVQMAIDELGLL